MTNEEYRLRAVSAADLIDQPMPHRTMSDTNVWTYDPELQTLTLLDHPDQPGVRRLAMDANGALSAPFFYEIDLESITTAEEVVRWLHHLSLKTWFSNRVAGDLVEAFCVHLPLGSLAFQAGRKPTK